MASSISEVSSQGFKNAPFYDAHRPSYSAEAVETLLKSLQVRGLKGARLVDLAAGTGKFTEILASQDEGFEIIAVEPHAGMRAELEKKQLSGVEVREGEARNLPVDSQSVDAVLVAQAFHWFANEEALAEIYRVLAPGGILGMIWNIEDYNAPITWTPTTEWESKLKEITWSFSDEMPRFRHEHWQQIFEKQLKSTPFNIQSADPFFSLPLGEVSFKFTHWLSQGALWDRYRTLSHIAVLEEEQLVNVRRKVFEIILGPDVERNGNGCLAIHGHTVLAWTSAIPGAPLKSQG